jgi:flagellar M-ring protein FliF
VAAVAAMVWYAQRPDWKVLFSGMDARDAAQVTQELTAAGVANRMSADGTGVEVPSDAVDKARIEVAAKGMPQSGRMGFELFDKPNWVGSEFDERVNYQRALEGELEHTIGTLAAVRSARVHLVLPKDALFGEAEQSAKASVVLQLRRAAMAPEQAESIRRLVAGAVENLSPDDVALVDADGRLNLAAGGQGAVQGNEEHKLQEKLVAMLEPTAGEGNVRATVTVSYDDASEEKTDEVYDPAQVSPLSTHKSEQTIAGQARAGGVPGTASNTPGASAPGSVQAEAGAAAKSPTTAPVPPLMQTAGAAQSANGLPVYPQGAGPGTSQTTEETDSYAVTRHLLHSERGPGRVRRVTAAVVVNDRAGIEGVGKLAHPVWKPRSAEEMQRLEQLARAAVGFEAARGDQVVIENVSFSSNVPEAAPSGVAKVMDQAQTVLNDRPAALKTLTVAGLGLLLVLGVLRPLGRQMAAALVQPPAELPPPGGASPAAAAQTAGVANGPGGIASTLTREKLLAAKKPSNTLEVYEHISEQIRREPAQSTRLLESWINAPSEESD